jgi:hypothetical protein
MSLSELQQQEVIERWVFRIGVLNRLVTAGAVIVAQVVQPLPGQVYIGSPHVAQHVAQRTICDHSLPTPLVWPRLPRSHSARSAWQRALVWRYFVSR